jgi:hypothetical protein
MLMQSSHLPSIPVRPTTMACTAFMFGDGASGTRFRQSHWLLGGEEIDIFHGLWDDEAVEWSSNWREFYNQVLGVEWGLGKGTIMKGMELFLFSNNFVTEHAYFSGTPKSKTLFDLILRLQHLEMKGELFIYLIWVAEMRMIEQGTDGVSRGDLVNGVMGEKTMLDFIQLNGLLRPVVGAGRFLPQKNGFTRYISRRGGLSGVRHQPLLMLLWNSYAKQDTQGCQVHTFSYVQP